MSSFPPLSWQSLRAASISTITMRTLLVVIEPPHGHMHSRVFSSRAHGVPPRTTGWFMHFLREFNNCQAKLHSASRHGRVRNTDTHSRPRNKAERADDQM